MEIKTKRLSLNLVNKDDYVDLLDLYQDKKVRQYLGGCLDETSFKNKFKNMLISRPPEFFWSVKSKNEGFFLGLVSVDIYHNEKDYEVSYQLKSSFWGQGYALEAVSAAIDFVFKKTELKLLYAETQEKNESSVKLLKNIGMKQVKILKRFNEPQALYKIQKTY